jgi:hypothetical protein
METDRSFSTNTQQCLKRKQPADSARVNKRTIKYLAECIDPATYTAVTRAAPVRAIHKICDAAVNIGRGDDVHLSQSRKDSYVLLVGMLRR